MYGHIHIYPVLPRGWGMGVRKYRIKGVPVFPTKYKKRIYQRKSIRKVISQCVSVLYTHTYPPIKRSMPPYFR